MVVDINIITKFEQQLFDHSGTDTRYSIRLKENKFGFYTTNLQLKNLNLHFNYWDFRFGQYCGFFPLHGHLLKTIVGQAFKYHDKTVGGTNWQHRGKKIDQRTDGIVSRKNVLFYASLIE